MKHYELLKLVPGTDPLEIQEKLWKGLRKLDDALDWLNHPVIYRSCRQEDDFDMMIAVNLEQEERISEFLSHPIRLKTEEKVGPYIRERTTFDHY